MKKIIFTSVFITAILIASCTKYRDVSAKYSTAPPPPAGVIAFGCLKINEFICKGSNSSAVTHLGNATAKWFEIYNPTTADIVLTPGLWYVTDTLGNHANGYANGTWNKCAITTNTLTNTNYVVPAKGFLVICCPKSGSTTPSPNHFNASFSLSSTAGSIGIYYQATPTSTVGIAIDTLNYNFGTAGASSTASYGCRPDGINPNTQTLPSVTCETSND